MALTLVELAKALSAVPHLAAAGGFELALGRRHDGLLTTSQQVEVRLPDRVERYWVKWSSRLDDIEKAWELLQEPVAAGPLRWVEAVAFVGSLSALVTVDEPGVPLMRAFDGGPGPWDGPTAAAHAATWLAALHGPPTGADPHPRAAVLEDVGARMARVGIDRAALVQSLGRELEATPDLALERVRTHGDYAPFNIVIREDGAAGVVLDPSFEVSIDRWSNRCSRAEDAARFLVCVELTASRDEGARRAAIDAFLAAYADAATPLADGPLRAFRAKYRLQAVIDRWPAALRLAGELGVERWAAS